MIFLLFNTNTLSSFISFTIRFICSCKLWGTKATGTSSIAASRRPCKWWFRHQYQYFYYRWDAYTAISEEDCFNMIHYELCCESIVYVNVIIFIYYECQWIFYLLGQVMLWLYRYRYQVHVWVSINDDNHSKYEDEFYNIADIMVFQSRDVQICLYIHIFQYIRY